MDGNVFLFSPFLSLNFFASEMLKRCVTSVYLNKTQTSPTSQETAHTHFAFCKNMHEKSNPGTGYGI